MYYEPKYDFLLNQGWQKMRDPVYDYLKSINTNPNTVVPEYLIFKNTSPTDFNFQDPSYTQDYNLNMSGGNEKMSYGALGLVEVVGSCNAVVVLDQMLKTSDVEFRTWHTKCGGHATIFLSGDIAAVKAAVDAVKGNPPCEIIAAAVISAPSEETSRLVKEEEEKHHK